MFVFMEIQNLYYLFLEKENVSTDTRNIIKDSIFFALKGENFDANQFAQQALDNGASYVVVDDKNVVKSDKFILVDDVLTTLSQLKAFKKQNFKLQENKIHVIIFTTPYSIVYLDKIPEHEKVNFNLLLENLKNSTGVRIYDLQSKYQDLPIWADVDHVAYHKISQIYSQDVAKIILNELN